jgi:hypothetical protein
MTDLDFSAMVGSAAGGGTVIFIAKLYLQRAFKDLDNVAKTMYKVQEELAIITTRLERFDKFDDMIHQHDRKIASLEKDVSLIERKD